MGMGLRLAALGAAGALLLNCLTLMARLFWKRLIGSLNIKESNNGFWVSFLIKSKQDLSDHGASKDPRNPLGGGFFGLIKEFERHYPGFL